MHIQLNLKSESNLFYENDLAGILIKNYEISINKVKHRLFHLKQLYIFNIN